MVRMLRAARCALRSDSAGRSRSRGSRLRSFPSARRPVPNAPPDERTRRRRAAEASSGRRASRGRELHGVPALWGTIMISSSIITASSRRAASPTPSAPMNSSEHSWSYPASSVARGHFHREAVANSQRQSKLSVRVACARRRSPEGGRCGRRGSHCGHRGRSGRRPAEAPPRRSPNTIARSVRAAPADAPRAAAVRRVAPGTCDGSGAVALPQIRLEVRRDSIDVSISGVRCAMLKHLSRSKNAPTSSSLYCTSSSVLK